MVRLLNDPVLRIKCESVNLPEFPVDDLLKEMARVMLEERGIGLAANQIGHSVRIFILRNEDSYIEYINPTILDKFEEVDFEDEGCLSIPGVSATTKRFRALKLEWYDRNNVRYESMFTGMDAFAVQHEMDHLDGKLYIDQFGPMKKDVIVRKHNKFIRATRR